MYFQIQVACRTTTHAGTALTGKTNVLALFHTLWNLHIEGALVGDDAA